MMDRNSLKIQIEYLRTRLMESLYDINVRRYDNSLTKNTVDDFLSLTESFVILSKSSDDFGYDRDSEFFERISESLSYEMSYKNRLNEKYGFENVFDNMGDLDRTEPVNIKYDMLNDVPSRVSVKKVSAWDSNVPNKIEYKNGHMCAGRFIGKGDTIEICPIRLFYEKDMYSENIRKFAMEIDRRNGVYGIPFGCATFYRTSMDTDREPNARYEYVKTDGDDGVIKIIATSAIKKGNEIILKVDRTDFGNEMKPGQFKYENGPEVIYSVKNFKFV